MRCQVVVMNLKFSNIGLKLIKFNISRGERNDKKIEKRLRIRFAGLRQIFIARKMLTELWLRHGEGVGLRGGRESSGRQKDAT
jgi:hypothetical protein